MSNNTQEEIYVLIPNDSSEWEDIIIFVSLKDAINELSNRNGWRIETFKQNKKEEHNGYIPTYENN